MNKPIEPFAIKDCALIALATGRRAQNLRELRDQLLTIHSGSIYYHFWGGLLHTRFDDPEYNNDFAAWAQHALHDSRLAERLGVIDPAEFTDIEGLRQELIEEIEERIEETEYLPWAKPEQQFNFIRAQTVIFDTGIRIIKPMEFAKIIPKLSLGSIYFHFIDARLRLPRLQDDFRVWLEQFGDCQELCFRLAEVDPYFISLHDLRIELAGVFANFLGKI